jgi:hypothetical protein
MGLRGIRAQTRKTRKQITVPTFLVAQRANLSNLVNLS